MKHNKVTKTKGRPARGQAVRFEFHHPTAQSVSVAGTFNEWRPGATAMISLGQGRWLKELILPPGRYEYRLVVDNEWIADPCASETAPNPFGGINSVLNIAVGLEVKNGKHEVRPHSVAPTT